MILYGGRRKRTRRTGRLTFAALLALCVIAGTVAAANLVAERKVYAGAQAEYELLRQDYAPPVNVTPVPEPLTTAVSVVETELEPNHTTALYAINPDYIGWLRIAGTVIDYPVVQGEDNDKYLTTGFAGTESKAGALFMDCRSTEGFGGYYAVIYGHNMKDGLMFAALNRYLEPGYLEEHPEIEITMPDGTARNYSIFAVKATDVTDPAYTLHGKSREDAETYFAALDAPEGNILVLSTCTNSGGKDKRLLVFAAAT